MIPDIESIINCYVDDLELMDELCNQKQHDMVRRTTLRCNTLDHWAVDRRLYHPTVEHEMYTVMANSIIGCYREMIYYIRALACKTHDLGREYNRSVGFERQHKLDQCLFLFEYGKHLIPSDFKAVCHYFFENNINMMRPGHICFNQLIPLAYFTLNNDPFVEPVQFSMNYVDRQTLMV